MPVPTFLVLYKHCYYDDQASRINASNLSNGKSLIVCRGNIYQNKYDLLPTQAMFFTDSGDIKFGPSELYSSQYDLSNWSL